MTRHGAILLALVGVSSIALGQPTAKFEFEVATVKPAAPLTGRSTPRGGPGTNDPEQVHYTYVSVKNLLLLAYGLPTLQITGPAWIDSERFDVNAKLAPGTTKEQVNVMLQNLLADRFKLVVHREMREVPIYELTVGKNGPKIKPYVEDPNEPTYELGKPTFGKDGVPLVRPGGVMFTMGPGPKTFTARKQSMAQLCTTLAIELERPVVDKTSLTGDYDYKLTYLPTQAPAQAATQAEKPSDAPDVFTAVQEQLGLKLESKKGSIEMLVVDSGQRTPTEN